MNLRLEPGKYVLAVSGGVDSVSLLDMLATGLADCKFVVAHFDHGMRPDSADDRQFVQSLTAGYGLPFTFGEGNLGAGASEDTARRARYAFLRRVQQAAGAHAILTAHHQDDLLETAIINLIRGTGRLGLSPLKGQADIVRPLLHLTKRQLHAYAINHKLVWREDSTNRDTNILRNHVRHNLLAKFSVAERQKLYEILTQAAATNDKLDQELGDVLRAGQTADRLERAIFVQLPHAAAREVMAAWLRRNHIRDFDTKTLERLVVAAKTGRSGSHADVLHGRQLNIGKEALELA